MVKRLTSWTDACKALDEQMEEFERKEEAARKAEAEEWRRFFNEDRVEELENCLRWLLNLHHGVSKGGGKPSDFEWQEAIAEAHRLIDG